VMVVAVMATFLGVSGASVAALIGSMGVGVVLALKESLSNIAGGFILLFMKPFVSGDYIHEDTHGNEGTVVKVDLFYTTLLTIDNRTVSIPNGIITNSSLTNISKQDKRQLREKVGISYRNDINEARKVLLAILQKDAAILKEEKIEVVVESLGDSGVILGWHAWVRPQDYFPAKWRMASRQIPVSSGFPGPGEMMIASGAIFSISAIVSWSFRMTTVSGRIVPTSW